MSEQALRFAKVVKRYGRELVLDEVDAEVGAGEFFGLVGINGAGKTTCIKALLDFCAIDAGSIEIFGVAHTEIRARSALAYLPERFLPPYYLTGQDFLTYLSKLHGNAFVRSDVESMFATLNLDLATLSKPVREYSKGMAQKLGLAGCFLSGKDLFVLDEPMSGLDPKARILLKRYMLELKSNSHTLFFSTHMLSDVEELCDRMAILHEGKLRFIGTSGDCCEAYAADTLDQAYLNCISPD